MAREVTIRHLILLTTATGFYMTSDAKETGLQLFRR